MSFRVAEWFAANPKAEGWATSALAAGTSWRAIHSELRRCQQYPGRDHTAVGLYLTKKPADLPVSAPAKPAPAPKKAPPERFLVSDANVRGLERSQDFFVTCAVSSSPVNAPALRALERAAAECGGKVVVLPIRYKNPTTRREAEAQQPDEWWDAAVRPYLIENEIRPHELLSIMTTRVQATAANPLPARIDSMTQARSAVFGHSQMAMRTVPTPGRQYPKVLYTSGAITDPVYSDTLAGDMARFHHRIAAVKVEVRGRKFHLRDIHWDGQAWTDIDRLYTPAGVTDAPPAAAAAIGDVHVGVEDKKAERAIFGPGGLIEVSRVQEVYFHDLYDGRAPNPHERHNSLLQAARTETFLDEARLVAEWLGRIAAAHPVPRKFRVVRSNHDEFIERWLAAGNLRPEDEEIYCWLKWQMLREKRETGQFPLALELLIRELAPDLDPRIEFLEPGQPARVGDVSYEHHGHAGPDGARGSPQNMARIGTKFVAGHIHRSVIWGGGYWVGVLARLGHAYAERGGGPSSWMSSHVLQGASGFRQMIHVIGDRIRG